MNEAGIIKSLWIGTGAGITPTQIGQLIRLGAELNATGRSIISTNARAGVEYEDENTLDTPFTVEIEHRPLTHCAPSVAILTDIVVKEEPYHYGFSEDVVTSIIHRGRICVPALERIAAAIDRIIVSAKGSEEASQPSDGVEESEPCCAQPLSSEQQSV